MINGRRAVVALSTLVSVAVVSQLTPAASAAPASDTGAPTVTSVYAPSMDDDPQGGGNVYVYGTGFTNVQAVLFGGTAVQPTDVENGTFMEVTAPEHAPGTVAVRVRANGRLSPVNDESHYTYLATPTSSWSGGDVLDPYRGAMTGLSCPTSTSCMAIDHNSYTRLIDGKWTKPQLIATQSVNGLLGLSCPTMQYCMATDDVHVETWDGSEWMETNDGDQNSPPDNVSCPAAGACFVANSRGPIDRLTNGTWRRSLGTHGAAYVSCASTTWCVAVSATKAWQFNGTSWTAFGSIDSSTLADVSCGSATDCVAVDVAGQALRWDGTTWSAPVTVFPGERARYVSCGANGVCVASDMIGEVAAYDGHSWGAPVALVPQPTAHFVVSYDSPVSCEGSVCRVVDGAGRLTTYRSGVWSTPKAIAPSNGSFTDISCTTTTFCAASDSEGNAYVYRRGAWTGPHTVQRGLGELSDVSCSSFDFCLMTTSGGAAATWNGSKWTSAAPPDEPVTSVSCFASGVCYGLGSDFELFENGGWSPLTASPVTGGRLSCSSISFCGAVGGGAYAVYTPDTGWTDTGVFDGEVFVEHRDDVSCPRDGFCMASTQTDQIWRFSDGQWRLEANFGGADGNKVLSCTSPTFCASVDGTIHGRTFDGTSWTSMTRWSSSFAPEPTGISCVALQRCIAVDNYEAEFSAPAS